MAGHLPEDAAVASPDHKHRFRVWMGKQGNVGHHLMVGKLVPFRKLDYVVQDQHLSIASGHVQVDLLEIAGGRVQGLFNFNGQGHARPHGTDFGKPPVHYRIHGIMLQEEELLPQGKVQLVVGCLEPVKRRFGHLAGLIEVAGEKVYIGCTGRPGNDA